jgi:hypothetical protein
MLNMWMFSGKKSFYPGALAPGMMNPASPLPSLVQQENNTTSLVQICCEREIIAVVREKLLLFGWYQR